MLNEKSAAARSAAFAQCPFCNSIANVAESQHVADGDLTTFDCPECNQRFVAAAIRTTAGHSGPKQPLTNQERAIGAMYIKMMPPNAVIAGLIARCYTPGRPESEVYDCIGALQTAAKMVDMLECAAVDYEIRSLSNPPPNEVSGATPIGAGSGSTPSPGADSLKCPNCGSPVSLVGQSFVSEGVDQSPVASCVACGYQFIPEPPETAAAGRRAERNANGRGNSNPSTGSGPRQPILNGRRDLSIAAKCLSRLPPKLLISQILAAACDDPARLAPTVYAMKQAGEAAELLDAGVLEYEVQQLVAAG